MRCDFKLSRILIIILFFAFTTGCLSLKPASVKSGRNLFESFFVGEEGVQYFIKPLVLFNVENKEKVYVDFTFRYKDEIKDSAIVNLSFEGSNIYKRIDSLTFSNTRQKTNREEVRLLFNNRSKDLYVSRFTTNISLLEVHEMFSDADWLLIAYKSDHYNTYQTTKRTKRAINKLRENIFIFLD